MIISTTIDIRQRNKERIRSAIQHHEKCTKAEVARETELSMATSSTALNEMLGAGEISKIEQTGFSIGRPADVFAYNRDYLHTLAICTTVKDGSDAVEYIVADALGQVILRECEPIDQVTCALLEALVTSCIARDPLIGVVGLGIPGHAQGGFITQCDIASLEQIDFAAALREKHDVTVVVENDMNIVTYGLYNERQRPNEDFATIYFPTQPHSYVGGGFIVGGRLLKGSTMFSGELSHVARTFGLSSAQQTELLSDRTLFREFAAKMAVVVACTINPPQIVMMGNALGEEDIREIDALCRQMIPTRDVPALHADNNIFSNYVEGLVRLTLDTVLFPTML